jgi:hypothetical protein
MPAGLMLANRLRNGFIDSTQVLGLSRDGLSQSGLAVARVTARAEEPLPGAFAGITVRLDGAEPHDRTPPDDPATNPLSRGTPDYDFYSLEVVQRIGYDSFTPDNGVLLALNKDNVRGRNGGPNAFNSFIWVIDAHPEDMNRVDYVKPNGEPVMRTLADYRQLNDALFHAGTGSGSEFEWEDTPNRLHFYVVDIERDERGILGYTLAVQSLDGAGPQARGATLAPPADATAGRTDTPLVFTLTNTGVAAVTDPALHPRDANAWLASDVYRLSVSVEGEGWSARLVNALAAVPFGGSVPVTAHVTPGTAGTARVTVMAVSVSDPLASATAVVEVTK